MNRNQFVLLLGAGLIAYYSWLAVAAPKLQDSKADAAPPVHFNRDIRSILSENCFACHGPDPAARKEGLRFDREEGLFADRKNGKVIVKGDPKKSLLYQRITSEDDDE